MNPARHPKLRGALWKTGQALHALDFAVFLPAIARLPLTLGYALARLRGKANALVGRDWRSMALGFRHIHRQTLAGLQQVAPAALPSTLNAWRRGRYETEARDEFEAALIAAKRLSELHCEFDPPAAATICKRSGRGLVLLTPHFDSFFIGVGFLARSGARINLMTSSVTHDPRVHPAVQAHFERKYRGLEAYLNGGKLLDMEDGARPFYEMLKRGETLVILADAPNVAGAPGLETDFLGRRSLAGGAVRMARQTGSDLGGFVCYRERDGEYRVRLGPVAAAADADTADRVYRFLSDAIRSNPERWWAVDLLPAMPLAPSMQQSSSADFDVLVGDLGKLAETDEFALGFQQLRRRIPSARWWHGGRGVAPPAPVDFLRYSQATAYLVILEPALIASDGFVDELQRVLDETDAACALPADPRCAAGDLAIDYASRPGFDRYVARRGQLDASLSYDGRKPWLYLIRRAAVQAAVDADPTIDWAALPAKAKTATVQRAFVHCFADYQRQAREEMLDLLPAEVTSLLDVGGGEGGFASAFVRRTGGRAIVAEPNVAAAQVAASHGLTVHAGPFETFAERLCLDCISFLDVLEHLDDPAAALRRARALLRPGGHLLLAVPNVGHWSVVEDLLAGDFTYLPLGILCTTHVRFYTRRSLETLLGEAGFEILTWRGNASPPPAAFLQRMAACGGADMESLATDSFHVLARKS
jgi:2-polyprenyl-3-methyl-5-hydroxy-6-metoxy-1,4-benzoquinol methylase